jgi:hypothetical protein
MTYLLNELNNNHVFYSIYDDLLNLNLIIKENQHLENQSFLNYELIIILKYLLSSLDNCKLFIHMRSLNFNLKYVNFCHFFYDYDHDGHVHFTHDRVNHDRHALNEVNVSFYVHVHDNGHVHLILNVKFS